MADESFLLNFAAKASDEVLVDGVPGIILEGYASRFGITDQDGETVQPGAFATLAEEWGHEQDRRVLFHHGMDRELGMRRLGKALDYRVDDQGLWVRVFVPKDPDPTWSARAKARFAQVYQGIKQRAIQGFSVAGVFTKVGSNLLKLAMYELSVTPTPCLESATFALGTKAVKALLGDVPLTHEAGADMMPSPMDNAPLTEGGSSGVLTRPAFGQVMGLAQEHRDAPLHDHLMARPAHLHGPHNAGTCTICGERRAAMGMKATLDAAERDDMGVTDFAYIDSDGNKHLPIHDAAHVRAAMARFNQTQFENDAAKATARTKILAAAKRFGIDASGFAETGAGKKAIEEAEALITRFNVDRKAGKRFSSASKESIRHVITTLQQLIAEEQAEEADEPATP